MKIFPKDKKGLMMVALGKAPADLAVINARLVNTFTGEVYKANVFIYDGFIAHVETEDFDTVNAKEVIDAQENFLTPGFIDAHVHIESSLMTPRNFAKTVLPHGTTMVVTDPHEIANVFGIKGVEYMAKMSEDLPMRMYINIPSCVPSVPEFEGNGATFTDKEIEKMLNLSNIMGLAEVMDFVGVANASDRMMNIIKVFEKDGRYIQGHAPGLTGRMLSSYLIGGPTTCHESKTAMEVKPKLRNGMYVDARSSSISKNLKQVVEGIQGVKFYDRLTVCTDDREVDEIMEYGHINDAVRDAIKYGLDPIVAIKSATLNNAMEVGLTNVGAIAAGYVADMLIIPSLIDLSPSHVISQGKLVAQDGKLLVEIKDIPDEIEKINSVNIKDFTLDKLILKAPKKDAKTVKMNLMQFVTMKNPFTQLIQLDFDVKDGVVDISKYPDVQFAAIINRYGSGNMTLGLVKGFADFDGALASTVSHDSHNLCIVFKKPEDAFAAFEQIQQSGGGMAFAQNGKVLSSIELNVAGLMSSKNIDDLAKEVIAMKTTLRKSGLDLPNPLLRIVGLSLIVIPEVKYSDLGLVDVRKQEFLPLFIEE